VPETSATSVTTTGNQAVPVLPLRDVVVYPHMVIPLFVGREKSILALDAAMRADKRIMLLAQKQADVDDPKIDDLYARHGRNHPAASELPDGTVKVLVEGVDRARIEKLAAADYYSADLALLPDVEGYDEREMDVLRALRDLAVRAVREAQQESAAGGADGARRHRACRGVLADTVAAHMSLKLAEKQKVLEILDVRSASSTSWSPSRAKWMCCRSRSAFADGSRRRWRRASASTT